MNANDIAEFEQLSRLCTSGALRRRTAALLSADQRLAAAIDELALRRGDHLTRILELALGRIRLGVKPCLLAEPHAVSDKPLDLAHSRRR